MEKKYLWALSAMLLSFNLFSQKIDYTVRFAKDSHQVTDADAAAIREWMTANYHYHLETVELRGHTDSDAGTDYNQNLSERRNESVKKLLHDGGFRNVKFTSYGESSPLCKSDEESCMMKNRRVEIVLYNDFSEKFMLEQNLPIPQTTFIDNEKGDIVIGEQGTEIYIPKLSFVRADGTAPQGDVRIELNEFYNMRDCVKSKLTTTSDGKILKSGGMVFIEAFDESGPLEMASDASLNIIFTTQKDGLEEGMQPFIGKVENGMMNWVQQNTSTDNSRTFIPPTKTEYSVSLYSDKVYFQTHRVMDVFGDREGLIRCGLMGWDYMTDEEKSRFDNDPQIYWQESQKSGAEREKMLADQAALEETNRKKNQEERLLALEKRREEFQAKTRSGQMKYSLAEALAVNSIGWLNCDKFYSFKEKTELMVKCEIGRTDEMTLVFQSFGGAISGFVQSNKTVSFANVPVGEEAFILYRGKTLEDGRCRFAMQKITIGKEVVEINPEFKTIDEIENAMGQLAQLY